MTRSQPIEYINGKPVFDHNATYIRPAQLVRFGSVVAKLQSWAELHDLGHATIRHRMQRGERVIDALRPANQWKVQIPWELDMKAQAFVREHPDGALLEEVGEFFGLTRERIRQLQDRALAKLLKQMGKEWRESIEPFLAPDFVPKGLAA